MPDDPGWWKLFMYFCFAVAVLLIMVGMGWRPWE